jgi:hypothetical protein
MTVKATRRWLGIYFLVSVTIIGLYLLSGAKTVWLPLSRTEAVAIFSIVIPVFVGQIASIFQWMQVAAPDAFTDRSESPIPGWAIILPPSLALGIFFVGAIALVISNLPGCSLNVGPDAFRDIVTFSLSILNASTVLFVPRIFPAAR